MMYIGRFAPSPTGPLHFGSLIAALASYCDAKANNGQWLVRMEDIDKPREMAGAADDILRTLEAFGFEWDGEIAYQSQRSEYYEIALQTLKNLNLVYACTCSRKEIADSSTNFGIEGAIYNKNCLSKSVKLGAPAAWRLNTSSELDLTVLKSQISFNDAIQGEISQNIPQEIGDFVLKRADSLFAYQLAVVVDDTAQGVTHILRGADLLNSTPRQIYLQNCLDFTTPTYAHIPIIVNAQGEKLSKQTLATAINIGDPAILVFKTLQVLGQQPPKMLVLENLAEIWRWAIANWALEKVPKQQKLTF